MTHDFKEVLDIVRTPVNNFYFSDVEKQTIIAALRIADKLMQEPSEYMILNARDYQIRTFDHSKCGIFKAMRDQMLRELNISTEPVSIPSAADTSQNVEYEKD